MAIDLTKIHTKRQKKWHDAKIYKTSEGGNKPKSYILDMFPYPSGAGLHVGHPKGYIATDVIARKKMLEGYNVLHPMGRDAFGLPAEQFALKNKVHPAVATAQNVATFKKQLETIGFTYDRDREVNTTDPSYYQWTQRIFLQLYNHYYDETARKAMPIENLEKIREDREDKDVIAWNLGSFATMEQFLAAHRMAYTDYQPVNRCPSCKTGLANEDLEGDVCERCGSTIEKKPMKQWMLRITKYADRLLEGLDELPLWPDHVKQMQHHWIGRKEGINIVYPIVGQPDTITCFTTRPDTNFGATFIVLAPEHPFVKKIIAKEVAIDAKTYEAVCAYAAATTKKTADERITEGRKKTGVFTGFYVEHRLCGTQIPLWISDFVLADFGTGAVVGVPGHDRRDFEFATTFSLPVIRVVIGTDGDTGDITDIAQVQEDEGVMTNSDFLDGMDIHDATQKIMDHYEAKGWGKRVVTYRLQERVFSRQRYRGEPIPMVWTEK